MCEFCKRFDFSTAKTEVDKHGARLLTGICNTRFSEKEQFNFCPVCGRVLVKDIDLRKKAKFEIWHTASQVLERLEETAHDYKCELDWTINRFKDSFDGMVEAREYEVD